MRLKYQTLNLIKDLVQIFAVTSAITVALFAF